MCFCHVPSRHRMQTELPPPPPTVAFKLPAAQRWSRSFRRTQEHSALLSAAPFSFAFLLYLRPFYWPGASSPFLPSCRGRDHLRCINAGVEHVTGLKEDDCSEFTFCPETASL